jgi:probable addiction module antidote protein
MRIHYDPGYRVYYMRGGERIYLLLVGWRQEYAEARYQGSSGDVATTEGVTMGKVKFAPFDAADYLDNEDVIAEYLTAALEHPNPQAFLRAVANVAKARGMARVAKDSGLGRESLYKALAPGAKPRYETVRRLMDVLGVKLTVTAA